jgi:DNA-binding PadR family transcriptional regulator
MLKIRSRVAVFAVDSDRIVYFLHRERVAGLISARRVRIEEKDATRSVKSVRLTDSGARLLENARPGSFGVHREHVAPGIKGVAGVVFSHKRTYEKALAS